MNRWRRVRQLTLADYCLLGQSVCLLPLAAAGLRCAGYNWCRSTLARAVPCRPREPHLQDEPEARRIARLVNVVARRMYFGPTCLHRSLVLWWLLRRRGIDAALTFGARMEGGQFHAHAWVELLGRPLNDVDDIRLRFQAFEPAKAAGRMFRSDVMISG